MKFSRLLFSAPADIGGSGTTASNALPGEAAKEGSQVADNLSDTAAALPKTQEELQAYLSKELDEKLTEKQKQWSAEQEQKIAQATSEAERLAKLSADEREKEILKQKTEEITRKEAEFKRKEIEFEAVKILAAKGFSPEFTALVCSGDVEQTKANIDLLEKHIKIQVEKGIDNRLKSKPPVPGQIGSADAGDFMKAINANKLR